MSLSPSASAFRLTGWHVLAACVAFFGVVVAADTGFVIMSVKTFPGEVSVTPYEDGLLYDKALAQQAAQQKLGWRAVAATSPQGVSLDMLTREGAPIRGLEISGKLERPATESGRRILTFHEVAPGRYVAASGGITGSWDMTATAHSGPAQTFVAERRLSWP